MKMAEEDASFVHVITPSASSPFPSFKSCIPSVKSTRLAGNNDNASDFVCKLSAFCVISSAVLVAMAM